MVSVSFSPFFFFIPNTADNDVPGYCRIATSGFLISAAAVVDGNYYCYYFYTINSWNRGSHTTTRNHAITRNIIIQTLTIIDHHKYRKNWCSTNLYLLQACIISLSWCISQLQDYKVTNEARAPTYVAVILIDGARLPFKNKFACAWRDAAY